MSSPTDRIRGALARWTIGKFELDAALIDNNVHLDQSIFDALDALADAARSFVEGEPIQWCETHRSDGVPRLTHDPTTCWKAEFTKHLDAADCSIVARWLSERPAAHLPGDDD